MKVYLTTPRVSDVKNTAGKSGTHCHNVKLGRDSKECVIETCFPHVEVPVQGFLVRHFSMRYYFEVLMMIHCKWYQFLDFDAE
jgi:hypothetical protein